MMMKPSKQDQANQKRYQAESDLHTLVEAQRILADKARSEAVQKAADEQSSVVEKRSPSVILGTRG